MNSTIAPQIASKSARCQKGLYEGQKVSDQPTDLHRRTNLVDRYYTKQAVKWRAGLLALLGLTTLAIGLCELLGLARYNLTLPTSIAATTAAEEVATTTAGVYVSLRIINAALSTAQEVELGASLGAQASLQPLKVLEPMDDTVERVADLVFAVAAGAALATLGFGPLAALGLCLLGGGCLLMVANDVLLTIKRIDAAAAYAIRLGLVLGIVLPASFAGGVALGEKMTAPKWSAAISELNAITEEARILIRDDEDNVVDEVEKEVSEGLFARLGAQFQAASDGVGEAVEAASRYLNAADQLFGQADALFHALLTIIGVFTLRTLVLPAILLWILLPLLRRMISAA